MTTADTPILKPPASECDHIRGLADAPVTLVEYGDYECPHCRQVAPVIEQLRVRFGDRLCYVFRHFPITTAHPYAQLAAEAAEAAAAQGKFWDMHDRIFEHTGPLSRQQLVQFAQELDLDMVRFERELDEHVYAEQVRDDFLSGVRGGANGTVAFFLNGVRYDGPWDLGSLIAEIEKPLGVQVRLIFQRFTRLQASGGILLLVAAAVALLWANSIWGHGYFDVIILGVVLVNAVVGFIQEAKAEAAIEALAETMTTEATVFRAGQTERISAVHLVPGDVVSLSAGDKVPADVRLVRARDLQIAEVSLTGESVPVQKTAHVSLVPDTPLAERQNKAYASTLVTSGQGVGIVTAIGDSTEVGRVSQLISSAAELTTPLTCKIASFSRLILYAILVLAAAAFGVGVLRGESAAETLPAAIALAVGMIPEGLPTALTVTLAIGVVRMSRRQAIIRKLPAVEALGSVTVICSDKTGTLTQNQMTVQEIVAAGARYEVTGTGYVPQGRVLYQGAVASFAADAALAECLQAGQLCNDSALLENAGDWQAQGDPTEVALIVSAYKVGLSEQQIASLPRLDAVSFESERQYMATLHDAGADRPPIVYVKGAAEAILARCTSVLDASGERIPLDTDQVHRDVEEMAARGLHVLAFARGELPPHTTTLSHVEVAAGLTFLGLQGMIDPPRPEAVVAVQACQQAGIQVKMITGDHPLTAAAMARQLGLNGVSQGGGSPAIMTGRDVTDCCDEELMERIEQTAVFARVSPEQELRLVEALQARHHVVSMTGDGVNDGPAIKQADVGVAMGITGTDVAKEAADMVLIDDNFPSIEAAVEEGRGVFDNLTKIIAWTLPTNLGEGLIILLAILSGVVLPILPVHILWINMTTVGVQRCSICSTAARSATLCSASVCSQTRGWSSVWE
jgi:cation-transporting ATPase F